MIVKVVESDLAPRNHLGMPRQMLHRCVGGFIRESRLVRMNADGRVHKGMFLGESNARIERGWPVAVANGDHGLYSGFARANNHILAVEVELLAIQMCVR